MNKAISFCLVIISLFQLVLAQDQPLLRHPAISPDGQAIAYSYQGDIWMMPVGGTPQRLTIHEAYEYKPRFSPDGSKISFNSDRFGNADVFVIGTEGGGAQRLTYHSARDEASSWASNEEILLTTRRVYFQVEREDEIAAVGLDGGTPVRYLDALGSEPVLSPDGRFVAFVKGNCRITREAYQGPANRDLWLYDTQNDTYHQLTTSPSQDLSPRWTGDRELYFMSARSGRYNIHAMTISDAGEVEGEIQAITAFMDHGLRYFDVDASGETMVFERMGGAFMMKSGEEPVALMPTMTADYRFDPIEHKRYSNDIDEYAVSPDGKNVALIIRGEVVLMRADEDQSRALNLTKHPYRDRDVAWLSDTTLIFASDREGQYDLFLLKSADPAQSDLFRTLKLETIRLTETPEDESNVVVSPDQSQVAYLRGRGELLVSGISEAGLLEAPATLLDGWSTPEGVSWSPDGKWLAYSLEDLDFNSEIYIHKADDSIEPVNVSMHPKSDYDPVWSPDGSRLGFLSVRNNGDSDVWFAWLKEEDWEKTQQEWEAGDDLRGVIVEEDTSESDDIQIDLENIYRRLTQVTELSGNEYGLAIGPKGEKFYYITNGGGRTTGSGDRDLYEIKWDGSDNKAITQGGASPYGVSLSPKKDYFYHLNRGGTLGRIKVGSTKSKRLSFNVTIDIDHVAERQQILDEAWRVLDAGFYDPNFHGQDWDQLREIYSPWALNASSDVDFASISNWMLGQLNASHMGIYSGDRAETQRERTGLLGVALEPVKSGLKVTHVVPGSPADRSASRLMTGDVITSINGNPVGQGVNIYQYLINQVNEEVLLSVLGEEGEREVVIRPTSSLRSELYDEWVEERRQLTEQYSNGRLGYLHVQGMNWPSFERFERELTAAGLGKEGLLIDVRFNGGGWTTDYLMAVLSVQQHAYTIPRGAAENLEKEHLNYRETYPFGERLPLAWWTKPAATLCNATSYSNAEIFSHAFKTLDRGPLVGEPTFGAVISTGGASLINGARVRLPFRAWYVKATEENMELGPAVPDIILTNAPDAKAKGTDAQLEAAVNALLEGIDE